nr:MotA/TolQ/ExbB proton channel family protein [Calidifontimicrobium sp. SYSU G02091]
MLDVAIRRGGGTVAASGTRTLAQGLFWAWVLHTALALFVGWQVARAGGWTLLVERDPSRISLLIVALALAVTAWCGRRAWRLAREAAPDGEWARLWRLEGGGADPQAAQRLAERSHGPHETAWWFAASAIKLGLLGTVVGFIVMASRLAASQVFELAEVQLLLKQMTEGMAIALYTTLVGLVANLWLGLQLLLLDRLADRVAASIAGGELG